MIGIALRFVTAATQVLPLLLHSPKTCHTSCWSSFTISILQLFVFCRLEKVDGVFPVPHFDGKAVAAAAMRASGLPVTELITSIFNNNLTTSMAPRKGEDGVPTIALTVGDKATAWIAVEDIGRCAYAIIKQASFRSFEFSNFRKIGLLCIC